MLEGVPEGEDPAGRVEDRGTSNWGIWGRGGAVEGNWARNKATRNTSPLTLGREGTYARKAKLRTLEMHGAGSRGTLGDKCGR